MCWLMFLAIVGNAILADATESQSCLLHFPGQFWNCGQSVNDQVLFHAEDISNSLSRSLRCYTLCLTANDMSQQRIEGFLLYNFDV